MQQHPAVELPDDVLPLLLTRLPANARVRLSSVSRAWHKAAAAAASKHLDATVKSAASAESFSAWLRRNGEAVESMSVAASCNEQVAPHSTPPVPLQLPCDSLANLQSLRLSDISLSLSTMQGDDDDDEEASGSSLLESLTSLQAVRCGSTHAFIWTLPSLRDLVVVGANYPTLSLRMMAALTRLTRLQLDWTEDVACLFQGLPALQELQLGATQDPGIPGGGAMPPRPVRFDGGVVGEGGSPARQRLKCLKVHNASDISGGYMMLLSVKSSLTRLEMTLANTHSLKSYDSLMLLMALPQLSSQLAHLHLSRGTIVQASHASLLANFGLFTALTQLHFVSDASRSCAMSAMFPGGLPGRLAALRVLHLQLNAGAASPEADAQGLGFRA